MTRPVIAVHGGAWNIPDALWPAHRAGTRVAVQAGYDVLKRGGSALDAVESAICVLEDDPTFDAGRGSVLNREGRAQLDAGLMRGSDLGLGAIAAAETIRNPIRAARRMLEEGRNILFAGPGADAFACARGLEIVANDYFVTPAERENWDRYRATDAADLDEFFALRRPADTVGAIAVDEHGEIAAGNSTGGTPFKPAGRVGDSALPGCGLLADSEVGAAICTGWGEHIARIRLAAKVCDALRAGETPPAAAQRGLDALSGRLGGRGGVICVSREGVFGYAHNTARMAWAAIDAAGDLSGP